MHPYDLLLSESYATFFPGTNSVPNFKYNKLIIAREEAGVFYSRKNENKLRQKLFEQWLAQFGQHVFGQHVYSTCSSCIAQSCIEQSSTAKLSFPCSTSHSPHRETLAIVFLIAQRWENYFFQYDTYIHK